MLSDNIFTNRDGLRWCYAPKEYGPPKTLYNRWKQWSDKGVLARMIDSLAAETAVPRTVMIDATYFKAHFIETRLRSKKGAVYQSGRPIGRNKRGMNANLHVVIDASGRLFRFFTAAGQVSD